jgi:4-amino-4-deoxy-L-arabinose transferase-like glycosyltransferase
MLDQDKPVGFFSRLSPGVALMLLMLLAVALRAIFIVVARPMIQYDETAYVRMAQNISAGKAPYGISELSTTHFTILLPLFIAGIATVVRNFVAAGYIVATFFGALMLVPTYLLGKEFYSHRAGLMAAAMLAVFPIFISTPEYIYTETTYIFFLLTAAFFTWQTLMRWRIPCSILAGVSLGFAYLANPLGIVYAAMLIPLVVAVAIVRRHWRLPLRSLGLMLLFFALVASPYVVFLHHELGRWTYTGKQSYGYNYYAASHGLERGTIEWERDVMSLNDSGTEVRTLSGGYDTGPLQDIRTRPLQVLKVFAKQGLLFYREILFKLFPLWLLPLLSLGLFAAGWDRKRLTRNGFLLYFIFPVVPVTAMLAFTRFYMPYIPFVLVWAGTGWLWLEKWGAETVTMTVRERWQPAVKRAVPWVIAAAVLLPLAAYGGAMALGQDYDLEYRDAGQWIRNNVGQDQRVMYKEAAAFYADGVMVPLPYADYASTTRYAKEKNVDFLVISRRDILKWRPDLDLLIDENDRPDDWQLVQIIHQGAGNETYIFQLVA